jgi:PPK2 family polyphosphate:nucleotide phosphotransferase
VLDKLIVAPGKAADLGKRDPADRLGLAGKAEAEPERLELIDKLHLLQDKLWAEAARSLLLVLQGMDTSGKDGTIEHVFSGLNPQGVHDSAFKPPSANELTHDYLWRVHAACPPRGKIGIFNRSHYEDVVTVRVLELVPRAVWERRFRHVNAFERMLTEEGTTLVKVFLHISKEEQAERLRARLEDPEKQWKFRTSDLESRERWDEYMEAYDEALTQTSTEFAPWYVVPADRKWVRNVAVARLLVRTLEELDPAFPKPLEDLSDVTIA